MARVVVIGAGVAGMATAARLAVRRHDVTLVSHPDIAGDGPRALTHHGFTFQTGPSRLTLPAVYRDLFLKTGRPLEECVELEPLKTEASYHLWDGSTVVLPGVGVGRAAHAMGEGLGGTAEQDWRVLMARAATIWAAARPLLDSPRPDGPLAIAATLAAPDRRRALTPGRTLAGLANEALTDPRARAILAHHVTRAGADPARAPAALAVLPYVISTFGSWGVRGGLHLLALALLKRAEERGVEHLPGMQVRRIVLADGKVAGVELLGSDGVGHRLKADIVVADADPHLVLGQLLGPGRLTRQVRRLARIPNAPGRLLIMLAVADGDEPTPPGAAMTAEPRPPGKESTEDSTGQQVWFPDRDPAPPAGRLARIARPWASTGQGLDPDPVITVEIPDDPTAAPAEHRAWTIAVDVPRHAASGGPGTLDWDHPLLASDYADLVLARLAGRGGGPRGRILWRRLITPADVERATGAPGGTVLSTPPNGLAAILRRPGNLTDIPGLYLVGAGTHPGPGLPLEALSAEIVAQSIGRA